MIGGNLRCHNVSITVLEESDGQIGRFVCTVPTVEEVKGGIHILMIYVNQYTLIEPDYNRGTNLLNREVRNNTAPRQKLNVN